VRKAVRKMFDGRIRDAALTDGRKALLRSFLILAVAALFIISFAGPAASAQMLSFQGKVVSVDRSADTVTIQSGQTQHTFKLSDRSIVNVCNEPETIFRVHVGDQVTVWYHITGNDKYVADTINYPFPAPEMC
jgi:hypothetical protein